MLEALPRLAPAVLRHLIAYGDLLCEETGDALRQLRRRALGLAVAVTAGAMALATGCVWVIAATWDGPNRLFALGALCTGFVVVAAIGGWYARTGGAQPRPLQRLRAEWRADRREIEEIAAIAALEPQTANACERLRRSREELFALAREIKGDSPRGAGDPGRFPRSRIMRALSGRAGRFGLRVGLRVGLRGAAIAMALTRPNAALGMARVAQLASLLRPLAVRWLSPKSPR